MSQNNAVIFDKSATPWFQGHYNIAFFVPRGVRAGPTPPTQHGRFLELQDGLLNFGQPLLQALCEMQAHCQLASQF
jgi:hypothetical protein